MGKKLGVVLFTTIPDSRNVSLTYCVEDDFCFDSREFLVSPHLPQGPYYILLLLFTEYIKILKDE